MEITKKEFGLAISFAVLGFIFSMSKFLKFLGDINPLQGFLLYYFIVLVAVFILSKMGLVLSSFKVSNLRKTLGVGFIIFAFFVIFNWENPYVQYANTGSIEGCTQAFYGSEDGVTFWAWSFLTSNLVILRLLTYVFTPALFAIIGALLVDKKVRLVP